MSHPTPGLLLAAALAVVSAQPALAVNKCVNEEGDQIIYSDAPCATEALPVNAQDNTVELEPVEKQRARQAQAELEERSRAGRLGHDAQHRQALQIQRAAEAEERARAARNRSVNSTVPRSATVQNPTAPGPLWHR